MKHLANGQSDLIKSLNIPDLHSSVILIQGFNLFSINESISKSKLCRKEIQMNMGNILVQ